MKPTKAHTAQPAHGTHQPTHPPKDVGLVLAWLLFPVVICAVIVYRWRVMRARMGYRTVRYDG